MNTKSLFQKLVLCLVAGLACGISFHRIVTRFLDFFPAPLRLAFAVAILLGALIFALIWHKREKNGAIDGKRVNAFWIGMIRYDLAFDLCMFGLQKIFHLQFNSPMAMQDEPFSSLSSQWLTWSYFGHSHSFAVTIGLSQIAGAMLLLFNRTRLLGIIVLIPIMLNIILIDYFYELNTGVLVHALILFAALIYLLLLDYQRLTVFFLKHHDEASLDSSHTVKYAGRLSVIVIPLLLIYKVGSPDSHPAITGKYSVSDMKINGKSRLATSCADSLLTLVYFDIGNECLFEFNGQKRRFYGMYTWDEKDGNMFANWHFPMEAKEKPFKGILKKKNADELELSGMIQSDSMLVTLKLVRRKWE
jgi:hypothetical protein